MRIERVNESTIKFYLSYGDIEDRGFKQDDLWTSRKKGEEFFWKMMEEINREEEFMVDGPLWIQVHAFDKGIEFVVTKSKQDDFMHMPEDESEQQIEYHVNEFLNRAIEEDERLKDMLSEAVQSNLVENDILVQFESLEDLIQFAYSEAVDVDMEDLVYTYEGKYYYYVEFAPTAYEDDIHAYIATVLEYADHSDTTFDVLEEYGKIIFSHNVKRQIRKYFKKN